MLSASEFLDTPLMSRAETLLVHSFKGSFESISRINIANAVAGVRHDGSPAISFGSVLTVPERWRPDESHLSAHLGGCPVQVAL